MMMADFALYLDDSGHPKDQPYVVVAGYVASDRNWLAFEFEWRSALNRFSLADPFHMTDFMREKYSSFKRDQILSTLAKITNVHTLHPFVYGVDVAAWKRVNDEFALEECHGAPYAIAARGVAKEMHEWQAANMKLGDHLLTFVEEGTLHYGQMEQIFKRDSIPVPNRVTKSTVPVQSCDVLAWEAFNYMRSGSPDRPGKNLERLARAARLKKATGGIFLEQDLRRICEQTEVMKRDTLKEGDTIRFHSDRKRVRRRTIK